MSDVVEGWAMPVNSRKFHYFMGGRSLCSKMIFLAEDLDPHEPGGAKKQDDCAECFRRVEKMKGGA